MQRSEKHTVSLARFLRGVRRRVLITEVSRIFFHNVEVGENAQKNLVKG
jgi:hypothetical protein